MFARAIAEPSRATMFSDDVHRYEATRATNETEGGGDGSRPVSEDLVTVTQLVFQGSSAKWRRRQADYFSHKDVDADVGGPPAGLRSTSLAVGQQQRERRARKMEEVHGVDVSWTHHPNRGAYDCMAANTSRVTWREAGKQRSGN